jgi:hypothetical protein
LNLATSGRTSDRDAVVVGRNFDDKPSQWTFGYEPTETKPRMHPDVDGISSTSIHKCCGKSLVVVGTVWMHTVEEFVPLEFRN